jgi:hypothetical protein
MQTKLCLRCMHDKPLSAFYTKPTGGLRARCKECEGRQNSSRRSAQRAAKRAIPCERPQANNINPRPLIEAIGAWR